MAERKMRTMGTTLDEMRTSRRSVEWAKFQSINVVVSFFLFSFFLFFLTPVYSKVIFDPLPSLHPPKREIKTMKRTRDQPVPNKPYGFCGR